MMEMEGPRGAKPEEFNEVIDLINHVFRTRQGHEPTMKREFPLLLNTSNVNNMRVIKEDGKIVSDVNYMTHQVYLDGVVVNYGAIGGVCTHEDYEGRGFSTKILDDVEACMAKEGVSICLISGTRTLYTRRSAVVVKSFKRYDISPKISQIDFKIETYTSNRLEEMNRLYQQKGTRYKRSIHEFSQLVDSATHSWGNFSYSRHVLKKGEEVIGYVILRIIEDGKKRFGQVVEVAGAPHNVYSAICYLTAKNQLTHTEYHVHINDKLNHLDQFSPYVLDNQQGTIKIIDFKGLFKELQAYFEMYLEPDECMGLSTTEEGYGLVLGKEIICTEDLIKMTKLLFDVNGKDEFDLSGVPKLKGMIEKVFPLPMPWTMNLNYQ